MPMVRVDIPAGRSPEFQAALGEAIQGALHDALGVPLDERFHVVTEHPPGRLVIDPSYLGVKRSDEAVVIQITLNRGRDAAKKRRFFSTLADALHEHVGLRKEDVIVNLVEVGREDWSFGGGDAQLA